MEIVLIAQHRGAGVVQIEKGLQIAEIVSGAQSVHRRILERDAVFARQLEGQFRFERAFDMQMQFGLGNAADEVFDRVHAANVDDAAAALNRPGVQQMLALEENVLYTMTACSRNESSRRMGRRQEATVGPSE